MVPTLSRARKHGGDDADEHERRADHRVDEELQRGVDPLVVAPSADEEVHRHEHDLEEHEEQEQVEADERADDAGLEQQDPGGVRLLVVMRVGTEQGDREQHAREHDEEQRDAVDTDVPADAPLLDPLVLRRELVARLAALERLASSQRDMARDGHA